MEKYYYDEYNLVIKKKDGTLSAHKFHSGAEKEACEYMKDVIKAHFSNDEISRIRQVARISGEIQYRGL